MAENNEIMSVEGQLVGMPLAGPESFSQQQLAYLKQALHVDETVLWEAPTSAGTSMTVDTEFTLSEAMTNFEKIALVSGRIERGKESVFYPAYDPANVNVVTVENVSMSGSNIMVDYVILQITSTTKLKSALVTRKTFGSSAISTTTPTAPFMFKIIGINRIAGGN